MGSLYATAHSFFLNRVAYRSHVYRNKTRHIRPRVRMIYSKRSDFQDFQGYANPSRLLPATETQVCIDPSLTNILKPLEVEGVECVYKIKLHTSGLYGSGLNDSKAGILICLVDDKGDSILQRIPAFSINSHFNQFEGDFSSDIIHFQRGSIDEFTFVGPALQKIVALWIGLESGQWRPGKVNLIVAYQNKPTSSENNGYNAQYIIAEYSFEIDDILLGEGSDTSMIELRPSQIKELSGNNISLLSENLIQPISITHDGITKEESMREYANLKFSLLFYDVLLVSSGSSIAYVSAGRNSCISFLIGGTIGFMYLFLLERSVDRLAAPGSTPVENTGMVGDIFGKFEGPVSTLIIAFVFSVIAVKYGSNESAMILTPMEVMCGMLGFLVCKVAVVLAAFKTIPIAMEENK